MSTTAEVDSDVPCGPPTKAGFVQLSFARANGGRVFASHVDPKNGGFAQAETLASITVQELHGKVFRGEAWHIAADPRFGFVWLEAAELRQILENLY